jgi:hypothetical protein
MSDAIIGTPKAQARCATPLDPADEVYGIAAAVALWNNEGIFSSGM